MSIDQHTDPFVDPFDDVPDPVKPAPAVKRAGGYTDSVVELTLSLTPFGLPYSSVKIGGTFHHPEPVGENDHFDTIREQAEVAVAELFMHLGKAISEQAMLLAPALPAQPAGAYASAAPLGAPAPQQQMPAPAGGLAGMSQVANGFATPTGGLITVESRYGEPVSFPSMADVSSRDMEDAARNAFCTEYNVHPTMVKAFDNRDGMVNGQDKFGHAGRIIISKTAPPEVVAAFRGSIAWVDFNRDGSLKVKATKDFNAVRDVNILTALQQGVAASQQQAQAGGSYGARPF